MNTDALPCYLSNYVLIRFIGGWIRRHEIMKMLSKKLLAGLVALLMLLSLAPAALAEDTHLQVSVNGLYAAKDGSYQSVAVNGVFDVYQNDQKVGTLNVAAGQASSITLASADSVRLMPVMGSFPAEIPVSEYGYGVRLAEGRRNIAAIEVYANAGLFVVDAGQQASFELLDAQGESAMTFQTDEEGLYALDVAISAGVYTLRMTASAGEMWQDQSIEIVNYDGEDSILKIGTRGEETAVTEEVPETSEPVVAEGQLSLVAAGEFASVDYTISSGEEIIAEGVLSDESPAYIGTLPEGEYLITLTMTENTVLTAFNGNAMTQWDTARWKASVTAMQESVYTVELTETGSLIVPFENITDVKINVTGERESFEMTANAEGIFEKKNILPGSYTVNIELPVDRYEYDASHWKLSESDETTYHASMTFGVSSGSVTTLPVISRITAGAVGGVVKDTDGDAISGVQVTIYDANGQIAATAKTDKSRLLYCLNKILFRKIMNAKTVICGIGTLCVHIGAEEICVTVFTTVCLESLKHFLSVMEHHRSRRKLKIAKRNDSCIVPTLAFGVIHNKHVVGKVIAETESLTPRFFLRSRSSIYTDIKHFYISFL